MITSIYQEVELSLTENLIPVTVPVKQYDNRARKVRCVLYNNSVQYSVPQDCIVACSGTRPDGTIFHYTSETASDLVFVENGAVVFTITTFMTAQAGRFPLDVVMLSTAGDVLGSFSLTRSPLIPTPVLWKPSVRDCWKCISRMLAILLLCRRMDSVSVTSRNPAPSRNSLKIF